MTRGFNELLADSLETLAEYLNDPRVSAPLTANATEVRALPVDPTAPVPPVATVPPVVTTTVTPGLAGGLGGL